jgi:hypothetical protein
MKDNNSNGQKRPRSSIQLCREVSHFISQEQQKRLECGLPHTSQNDIVNDWLLDHAQCLAFAVRGYPSYPVVPFTQLYPSKEEMEQRAGLPPGVVFTRPPPGDGSK